MTKTYLMLNNRNGYVKIGVSNNARYREKTLQSEEPEVVLFAVLERGAPRMERSLHREYANSRLRGEWFALGPKDVQRILRKGFEPVNGRGEDFFWAYWDGMSYDAWMRAKRLGYALDRFFDEAEE
jgi:hypothetical protein